MKVLSQGALKQRNWTNQRGETVVISSVEVKMTDGVDTFVAEATDQLALQLDKEKLHTSRLYGAQMRQEVREWKNQQGEMVHANSVKLLKIAAL